MQIRPEAVTVKETAFASHALNGRAATEISSQTQSNYMTDDAEAPISRTEFHALAWRAANEKARELGWIV
jgi:hypothetical protein